MVDHEHQHSSTSNLHAVRLDHFGREAEQVPSPPAVVLPYGWMLRTYMRAYEPSHLIADNFELTVDFNTYSRVLTEERDTQRSQSQKKPKQGTGGAVRPARSRRAGRRQMGDRRAKETQRTVRNVAAHPCPRPRARDQRRVVFFCSYPLVRRSHRG